MQITRSTFTYGRAPVRGDLYGVADDWAVLPPRGTALGGTT
jgi:hypothetical protein